MRNFLKKINGFFVSILIGVLIFVVLVLGLFAGTSSTTSVKPSQDGPSEYDPSPQGGGQYSNGTYEYAGKKYTIFKQGNYRSIPFDGGNIGDSGCGVTSVAIIVSAYKNGETPSTIAQKCEPLYGDTVSPRLGYGNPGGVFHKYLEEYGLTCTHYEVSSYGIDEVMGKIVDHIKSGKPVIFNYQYGTIKCIDGSQWYSAGHFVTLLGMDNQGNIFVGDPAGAAVGYATVESLKNAKCVRCFLVTEK